MSIKGYLEFVKWYFVYRGNACFDNKTSRYSGRYHIRRKDRLPIVIFAYTLLIVLFPLALFVLPQYISLGKACYVAFAALFGGLLYTCICEFSFLYYFVLYAKYVRRNDSVNDKVIVDGIILREWPKDLEKVITKYYRIKWTDGNIFAVKYYLMERAKKHKRLSEKDFIILKITPTKIYFNKQEVFSHKITDLSDLEAFLQNTQNT